MPGPQNPTRFTPEELAAAQKAGLLTPELLAQMHPQDQRVAQSIMAPKNSMEDFADKFPNIEVMGKNTPGVMGPGLLARVPAIASMISKAGSQLAPMAKTGAALYGVNKASDMVGLPREFKDILLMMTGMKGMSGPYKKAAGGMAEEAAAVSNKPPVMREPPSSDPIGVGDNVHRGVQNDWGPGKAVSIRKPGVSLQPPDGIHDRMPVGSKADYQGWSDAQDSKFPPQGTSIEDLIKLFGESLHKK